MEPRHPNFSLEICLPFDLDGEDVRRRKWARLVFVKNEENSQIFAKQARSKGKADP